MKDKLRKISVSVILAVAELVLALLALINPAGLASFVIILLGIVLLALGGYHLFQYIRLSKEEAAETWKLSTGAGLIVVGISAITNQHWLVELLGTLTTLYALINMVIAFMKLQIAVDAFRVSRPYWYLMAGSFLVSAVLATLLVIQPFSESAVWIFTGIVLLILMVMDGAYFILGRKKA
ncbi:MAG: DUF308 domain-containing protein [Clostridiales bacterium]|nr:DUF308 domain-containing protein [Clostridiales bacterium]